MPAATAPIDLTWCEGKIGGWRGRAAGCLALAFGLGAACIWELALHPAGNWTLAVLFALGTGFASAGWVAVRRLDVVAAARAAGPELLLRRAHLRSGFFALACGVAFALLGRIEFGLMGRAYGDTGAGFAAGILIGLCMLCPAVLFTVGVTHSAARKTKAPDLERRWTSGVPLAPWEEPQAGSWVQRHWQGRYNLPRSFFLHGLALTVAVAAFSTVSGLVSTRLDVGLSAIIAFAFFMLHPPIVLWQEVGIWRSANRYRQYYGSWLAPLAAQVAVVLSLALLAFSYAKTAAPQVHELIQIVRGDPEWTPFSATVESSGRALAIHGNLQSGCHWEFDRVLAGAPDVRTVLIDSPGGRLAEGERIAAEVRRRKLDTCAVGDCESAATVIFLAGVHRTLGPKGELGFHSPSLPEASALLKLAMKFQLDFDMRAAGVSEIFVRRTLGTPPDSMWYPSRPVMLAAGVLTPG